MARRLVRDTGEVTLLRVRTKGPVGQRGDMLRHSLLDGLDDTCR